MASMIHIPESVSIGIQSLAYMSTEPDTSMKVKDLARILKVSEAHLAKVFQQMVKSRLLKSRRGPSGGFILALPTSEINILMIYEAIEGEIRGDACALHRDHCPFRDCIFGNSLRQVTEHLIEKFRSINLSVFSICRPEDMFHPDDAPTV